MSDAEACFQEGMKHIGLSHHADYHSEYVGDLEDAVACFERALALKPDHAAAWSEKGTALAILGRHEEAAVALAEAIRLRPEAAQLWLERAGSLQRLERYDEALAACNEALRMRAGNSDAMVLRAELLDASKRDAEALAGWNEVLGLGDLRTMNFHGRTIRSLTGDFRRLKAAIARAGVLARLGRRDEAIAAFRNTLDEGVMGVAIASDAFVASLGAHEAARAAYYAHIEDHRDDPQVWRNAGSSFIHAGRSAEALDAYEQSIRLAPDNPEGWYGKAESLFQAGRRVDAIAAYREALRIKPDYVPAKARLERVQTEIGRGQSDRRRPQ
jgi:tetratricopeptide (TPR) repeat protein